MKYQSKNGKVITKSTHHPDMWIIDYPSGKFATINTTMEIMLRMNPPRQLNRTTPVKNGNVSA